MKCIPRKYYMPTETELLNRVDPNYYESTPEVHKLHKHLCETLKINQFTTDGFLRKLTRLLITEEPTQKQMDLLEEFHIELQDIRQANEIFGMIADVSNHTRKWANCGFTPDELLSEHKLH